jgi:hypothetical protein
VSITITGVETVVAPKMDFVRMGVSLGFIAKLGSGLGGVLAARNLNQSLTLPIVITRVVGKLHMVLTNPITTIHVNKIVDRPPVSSMAIGGYKSADVMNPRGGYQEPSAVIAQMSDHKSGHYVKLNRVALKYFDLKNDANPYAHVKVFNFAIKANGETSKEYIINAFSYMLKDTTLD